MADKQPRWEDEPPPGFMPDGTSLIGLPGEVKMPEQKVKGPDGKLYSPEEYEELAAMGEQELEDDDDDLSDLDEIDEIAAI